MKLNTIRFKISVLYTAILGAILIVYTATLYISLYANLTAAFDTAQIEKLKKLHSTVESYAEILGDDRQSLIFAMRRAIDIPAEYPQTRNTGLVEKFWVRKLDILEKFWAKKLRILGVKKDYISFLDAEGKLLAQSPNMDTNLLSLYAAILPGCEAEVVKKNIRQHHIILRVISRPFVIQDKTRYTIQLGSSFKPVMDMMKTRLYYRLVPIPIILFAGFFIGSIFASKILEPAEEITKTAERISHRDLKARIDTKHMDEEMKYLGEAFNRMISRLEQSFSHIERFSANVAHELKTPLAIMRLELELALWEERSPQEYKQAIKAVLEELGRMFKIIQDLFLLTNLDFQPEVFKFEQIDFAPFIQEIYEHAKILAAHKNITVQLTMPQKPAQIQADQTHLRRLFFNLIENAIKFNKVKGNIDIIMEVSDKEVRTSIRDSGPGIEEKDLPRIFERFFHARAQSDKHADGSGLGLSIVKSIAEIHQGTVKVKSRPGEGATFTLALPLAQTGDDDNIDGLEEKQKDIL
ncbi:MAG: ATP-binding protein [Candidatus Omnitrophota bacterium]